MKAIYKKEMQSYFTSMVAYLFMACFFALVGIYFTYGCVINQSVDFAGYVLPSTCMWLAILIPMLTMRMWAEEKKQKTDQLLLTSPVSVTKIFFGKYLAAVTLFSISCLLLFIFPFMLHFYGNVDWVAVLVGMVGYFLLGCALIAIGFFISTITESQVIAAVISAVVILFLFFMENIATQFPTRARYTVALCVIIAALIGLAFYLSTKKVLAGLIAFAAGDLITAGAYLIWPSVFQGGLSKIVGWLSVMERFYNFTDGLFDVGAIVYFLSFIAVFGFLTVQSIEKTRWR